MSSPDPHLPVHGPRGCLASWSEGPRAWLMLARTAILVVGVCWLGWSAGVIVFQIWFDGVSALGAMLAFRIWALAGRGGRVFEIPPGVRPSVPPRVLGLSGLMFWLVLGIFYGLTLRFLSVAVFEDGVWQLVWSDPGVLAALLLILVSHGFEEAQRGYEQMSEAEMRAGRNWDFGMHLARVAGMLLVSLVMRLA